MDMESIDSLAKAINAFSGGMVLVSHDMRLISQVAQEIWMCDNRTVTKYQGDIRDFKMQLRRQMQLEDGPGGAAPVKSLAPSKNAPAAPLGYAPPAAPLASIRHALSQPVTTGGADFPPLAPPSSAKGSEEDEIRKARLELAELAIAKQRARQAQEAPSGPAAAADGAGPAAADGEDKADGDEKQDEKALARAKRKAEKDAQAALLKREEEERERRRLEKLRDHEEAMKLKEEEARRHAEFLEVCGFVLRA